jgi:putative tryptophan/tyrosine transport system substrate-binding protein
MTQSGHLTVDFVVTHNAVIQRYGYDRVAVCHEGEAMRRREFITVLGSALVVLPVAVRAQQSALPTVGFLNTVSAVPFARMADGFRKGLGEVGYAEGQNVAIEYRWAEGHIDQLPALAMDLVNRQVAVIAATGGPAAGLAAKAATSTIPIVFVSGADPVKAGLIASFNRPGANITGISPLSSALGSKRLEILHTLVPKATAIGMLVNPNYDAAVQVQDAQTAADAIGLQVRILNASSVADIDAAFASVKQQAINALLVANDPYLDSHRDQIIALAAPNAIPAMYYNREYVVDGGLISYGANIADAYRQAAVYCGKILKGGKPGDLPVLQPTNFELIINLEAAKTLGLEVPPQLIALADEVIE